MSSADADRAPQREVDTSAPESAAERRRTAQLRLANILLLGLFLLATFYTLYIARLLLIPIMAAILLSLLFSPVVRLLSRKRIPSPLSAALIVITVIGTLGLAGYQLSGPAAQYVKKLPETARRLAEQTREVQETVEEVQRAAKEAGELTEGANEGPTTVKVEGVTFGQIIVNATWQTLVGIVIIVTLLYFLLAGKDHFLEKFVGALPTISDKKRAVTTVRNVEYQVGSFLLAYSINNSILGAAVAATLWWLGMPNPLFFGVVAALFNFVPYAGAVATTLVIGLASATAFDDFSAFIAPPLAFLFLTTLEGTLMQPLIVGRRMALNPVAVFVALVFWAWLWGVPGALMAIPILAVTKAIFESVPVLRPIATFFGR